MGKLTDAIATRPTPITNRNVLLARLVEPGPTPRYVTVAVRVQAAVDALIAAGVPEGQWLKINDEGGEVARFSDGHGGLGGEAINIHIRARANTKAAEIRIEWLHQHSDAELSEIEAFLDLLE